MKKELDKFIESVYAIPYSSESGERLESYADKLKDIVSDGHFLNSKAYLNEIEEIKELLEDVSTLFTGDEDRLLQTKIQKRIANLARDIYEHNRKIFVVHGRDLIMRDRVCALLGRLKLDYVILESEHNNGATIVEKFLKNAVECGYSIVLFSGDDVGKLNDPKAELKYRTRQNVILELGYFLGTIGRKNIAILHQTGLEIEKPSDFDGIVYEPFDDYGAWKGKLIKELRKANIYIDSKLADRA